MILIPIVQIFLGSYPARRFAEKAPNQFIAKFKEDLDRITGEIQKRNTKLDVPYTYMLPSKVPNSITI